MKKFSYSRFGGSVDPHVRPCTGRSMRRLTDENSLIYGVKSLRDCLREARLTGIYPESLPINTEGAYDEDDVAVVDPCSDFNQDRFEVDEQLAAILSEDAKKKQEDTEADPLSK